MIERFKVHYGMVDNYEALQELLNQDLAVLPSTRLVSVQTEQHSLGMFEAVVVRYVVVTEEVETR